MEKIIGSILGGVIIGIVFMFLAENADLAIAVAVLSSMILSSNK